MLRETWHCAGFSIVGHHCYVPTRSVGAGISRVLRSGKSSNPQKLERTVVRDSSLISYSRSDTSVWSLWRRAVFVLESASPEGRPDACARAYSP